MPNQLTMAQREYLVDKVMDPTTRERESRRLAKKLHGIPREDMSEATFEDMRRKSRDRVARST